MTNLPKHYNNQLKDVS